MTSVKSTIHRVIHIIHRGVDKNKGNIIEAVALGSGEIEFDIK